MSYKPAYLIDTVTGDLLQLASWLPHKTGKPSFYWLTQARRHPTLRPAEGLVARAPTRFLESIVIRVYRAYRSISPPKVYNIRSRRTHWF